MTDFIKFHSSPLIPEKLREMRIEYKKNGIPTILDDSLNQLLLTLSIFQPKNVLEIGTATGMSGIAMLNVCQNARLTTIEKDEKSFEIAKQNFKDFKVDDRIKQFVGDAGEIINYLDGQFDFIFLDGAKARYFDYLDDLKRLLAKGGVLFADNVLFRGYIDGSVEYEHCNNTIVRNMRAFINVLTNDENFITQVYKIGDGNLISFKK